MTASPDLDGPHWRFAVGLYRRPGVQDACLALQEALGLDVVLLMAALHAATARGAPDRRAIAAAFASVRTWREGSVLPLREARRRLKGLASAVPADLRDGLRNRIKALELEAEQVELAVLAADFASRPAGALAQDAAALAGVVRDVIAAQGLDAASEAADGPVRTIADAIAGT